MLYQHINLIKTFANSAINLISLEQGSGNIGNRLFLFVFDFSSGSHAWSDIFKSGLMQNPLYTNSTNEFLNVIQTFGHVYHKRPLSKSGGS